jgi:hypothetical protein
VTDTLPPRLISMRRAFLLRRRNPILYPVKRFNFLNDSDYLSCVRAHARSGVNAKACAKTISYLPFASFMEYFLINSLSVPLSIS